MSIAAPHFLRRFFGQMTATAALARSESVARLVPTGADYITVGLVSMLPSAEAFNRGPAGRGPHGHTLAYLRDLGSGPQQVALLVLREGRLQVITESGEQWSAAVTDIQALDGHRESGFVVFMRDGSGLAVNTQTPVQVPEPERYGTVHGVTNAFSGWDQVLAPYGVARYW